MALAVVGELRRVNGVGGYGTQRADFVGRAAVDLCLPMDRARNGHTASSGQFANM
jgi:hypothetical protein